MTSVSENPLVIAGVRLGTAAAGIRYQGRDDLAVFELSEGSCCAAMFTRNAFCAAPVIVARKHLASGTATRYLLVNSGNANAGTGPDGLGRAHTTCAALAGLTGCAPEAVLPFSTGVIGEPLPVERLVSGLDPALESLSEDGWNRVARAIMTTDTRPKVASLQAQLGGKRISITGIAKGAGMIRPDMATMLAYVATDACVDAAALDRCLRGAADGSFNAITVDGDTSTNDACMLVATGRAGNPQVGLGSDEFRALFDSICVVCETLAHAIVRDAEGATKFIAVHVREGREKNECRQVAYTVAHSPLVKTAFFASDPNWGRILAAVGRAGLDDLDIDAIHIFLDDVCIVRSGARASGYTEEQGQAVMDRSEVTITIDLGRGNAEACVWTSDLSVEYVKINADYRS